MDANVSSLRLEPVYEHFKAFLGNFVPHLSGGLVGVTKIVGSVVLLDSFPTSS